MTAGKLVKELLYNFGSQSFRKSCDLAKFQKVETIDDRFASGVNLNK